ncbi:MAG: hypothetical protein BWY68_00505 [bacterium ADurb.Bin400]|nr:MAG: hypothetical protein BWY68_00505 [bacterium ADurb.Bin400]
MSQDNVQAIRQEVSVFEIMWSAGTKSGAFCAANLPTRVPDSSGLVCQRLDGSPVTFDESVTFIAREQSVAAPKSLARGV